MNAQAPIRIMLAEIGLDDHDRGVKVVARALRDAGMDVIYTGAHWSAEEVALAAVQEDVDVLVINVLSGAQLTNCTKVIRVLEQQGSKDIIMIGGGGIPEGEVAQLKEIGVSEILQQNAPPDAIISRVRERVAERGPR